MDNLAPTVRNQHPRPPRPLLQFFSYRSHLSIRKLLSLVSRTKKPIVTKSALLLLVEKRGRDSKAFEPRRQLSSTLHSIPTQLSTFFAIMRLPRGPIYLAIFFNLVSSPAALPNPSPEEETLRELLESRYHYLAERVWCNNPCGSGGLCCGSSQSCITVPGGQPQCSDEQEQGDGSDNDGQWELFTTIYLETDVEIVTVTSVYSSQEEAAQTAAGAPAAISGISCDLSLGEKPCATLCCATGQYCAYPGQCAASNGQDESSSSVYVLESTAAAAPSAAPSAPLRPTSNGAITVTATGSVTTTMAFQTPSAAATSAGAGAAGMTATSNNGLSGGAIAGIVIGVLAGLFLFFLICAILCCRGIIDAILDFFGLRNRRRKETIIEERYSHHGGASGGGGGRTWWGGTRPARIDREKQSSGIGGWTTVAGGLTALAVGLGLKRRYDRKKEEERRTDYSSSYDYYSDSRSYTGTSPSK